MFCNTLNTHRRQVSTLNVKYLEFQLGRFIFRYMIVIPDKLLRVCDIPVYLYTEVHSFPGTYYNIMF